MGTKERLDQVINQLWVLKKRNSCGIQTGLILKDLLGTKVQERKRLILETMQRSQRRGFMLYEALKLLL